MNKTQQQFFALLRSGLWNQPIDSDLFSKAIDWDTILKMAQIQTVGGILFDGSMKLSSELQPPKTLMRSLYQTVIRIEQSHELLNKRLTEIAFLLQTEDIRPVLLKGQGMARNYPNPVRRQCGDIDLYVGKKDYKKACKLVRQRGIVSDDEIESPKHYHFGWNGVNIEFHRITERLRDPVLNRRFQVWTAYHLHGEKLRMWHVNGVQVLLPPVNFDALYIFNHIYYHFIAGGIGLRQLCDWMLYLHRFKDQIDREELLHDLRSVGLLKPWLVFGGIIVDKLGLPKHEFPFYSEKYRNTSEKVLKKILQSGNFGFYNPRQSKRPSGFLPGIFHSFLLKQKWIISISPVFPKETLLFSILYWHNGIISIIKGRYSA